MLGGSSSINHMSFGRGSKEDYDNWEKMGATGWGYNDVLKYLQKLEDASSINDEESSRGLEGPLKLSITHPTPLARYFIEAGKELGDYF